MSQPFEPNIPIIDVAELVAGQHHGPSVDAIGAACRRDGFFYVVGHGTGIENSRRLHELSERFFRAETAQKLSMRMALGGAAWRGYFPVGAELTDGQPDIKEGLYFGEELGANHPWVRARRPMHGANLFPDLAVFPELVGFREAVLEHMTAMTGLGHVLMRGIAASLGLDPSYFADRYTRDPLILFRIFHYPPLPDASSTAGQNMWSVGEHTDYGVLTILLQDATGGLQVKSRGNWIDAPPVAGSFVCNIGDMLDRMTGGFYRSTPHRVRNAGNRGRLSFPFFFDPNFDARIQPIDPDADVAEDRHERWDRASVHEFEGTYGEYLLSKVARVFPELGRDIS